MTSGDDKTVEEARRQVGDVEGAVVKQAISFHAANTLSPAAAQTLIRVKAGARVLRRASIKSMVMPAPVRLDVTFKNYRPAEMLAYLAIVQRPTCHAIRFTGQDMIAVSRFIEFIGGYEPGLSP